MKMHKIEVNQIEGFRLGNAEDKDAATGCTVIICEKGAVGGVDVRGGAPATRDTELLRSENTVQEIYAVVLSGGSAFGLEAASGVMRFLSEKGVGFKIREDLPVPIVCGASLYDLEVGRSDVFPDVEMGIRACENAYRNVFGNGNNGAGTGASCGKLLGMDRAMKTGLGTYAVGDDFLQIGAISAVNAVGDIMGGAGDLIAGLRSKDGRNIKGTVKILREQLHDGYSSGWEQQPVRKVPVEPEGVRLEKDTERTDIAAAMMAAFESSMAQPVQTVQSEADEAASASAGITPADSAAAYVEAFKAKALERAEQAVNQGSLSSPQQSDDEPVFDIPLDEYLNEDMSKTGSFSRAEMYADVPDAEEEDVPAADMSQDLDEAAGSYEETAGSVSTAAADAGSHMQSYDELWSEAEREDDDLGYDIPFNTVISCVITNAKLNKPQANKLATVLHDAYARAIKPTHMTVDGDTIFVMATGEQEVNFDAFAALATDVLQYAIIDGARSARSAYGLPAARDMAKTDR